MNVPSFEAHIRCLPVEDRMGFVHFSCEDEVFVLDSSVTHFIQGLQKPMREPE
ncbi:MAG: hypothetical protein AAFP93_01750 [Bacteroidota bacterium]